MACVMNGRLLLLLASVLVAARADDSYCCVADQFQVTMEQLQGLALPQGPSVYQYNTISLASDFKNKRVGEEIISNTAGHISKIKVIIDYKANVMYTILGQTCTKTEARGLLQQCIPKTDKLVETTVLGDNELTADVYSSYQTIEKVFRGNVSQSISRKGCVPVRSGLIGEGLSSDPPIPLVSDGSYVNFTRGIKDPSRWFDVPSICQQQRPVHPRFAAAVDAPSDADQQLASVVGRMALWPFVRH